MRSLVRGLRRKPIGHPPASPREDNAVYPRTGESSPRPRVGASLPPVEGGEAAPAAREQQRRPSHGPFSADRPGRLHPYAMAVTFEQTEPELRRLREFVLNDLDRIVDQPVGGNYAAVAVALCAYDAIANLEGGANARGERPFADSLPQAWRPVAPTLYNALRNGLVHTYETKTVLASGRQIELVLSWRERPHLTFE